MSLRKRNALRQASKKPLKKRRKSAVQRDVMLKKIQVNESFSSRRINEKKTVSNIAELIEEFHSTKDFIKLDKMECKVTCGYVEGSPEEITLYRSMLDGVNQESTDPVFGKFPTETEGMDGRSVAANRAFRIVSRSKVTGQKRLIAGQVWTRRFDVGIRESLQRCSYSARISYNPTKVTNLYPKAYMMRPRRLIEGLFDGQPLEGRPEKSIDREFNLLRSDYSQRLYERSELKVIRAVFKSLPMKLSIHGLSVEFTRRLTSVSFYRHECVWDVDVHDSFSLLEELAPLLSVYKKEFLEREYCNDMEAEAPFEEEIKANCKSYRIYLTKSIELAIYAKTTTMLRFEVRLKKLKGGDVGSATSSATSLDQYLDMIREHKRVAQARLSKLFKYLAEVPHSNPRAAAGTAFFARKWFRDTSMSNDSCRLLELLKANGYITNIDDLKPKELRIIKLAIKGGLLRQCDGKRIAVTIEGNLPM